MALRFFIGILGGSFVPCQVWSTGFFDKNVVGTSNALTAGFGNAGGGITYFMMPAIYDSLVHNQGLTPRVAWRVAFIVPFICIVSVAIALLLLCPDTPTGKWSGRHAAAQQLLAEHGITANIVDVPGSIVDKKTLDLESTDSPSKPSLAGSAEKLQYTADARKGSFADNEAQLGEQQMLDTARGEVIVKPTLREAMRVVFSAQTLVTCGLYFCSFGAELAINSILGAYYLKNFPYLKQTGSGRWAAMFGLLNVVFRPAGGVISDYLFKTMKTVWAKKMLCHALAFATGAFLIAIGVTDSHDKSTMFGLIAGMGFFLEAGNVSTSITLHPNSC
jgi:NNP family nitrate/nitrite transporter-like MFS transporter